MSMRQRIRAGMVTAAALATTGCAMYASPVPGVETGVTVAPPPVVVAPPPAVVYGGGYYGGGYYGGGYYARPHYPRYYAPPPAWRSARPIVPPRGRPY